MSAEHEKHRGLLLLFLAAAFLAPCASSRAYDTGASRREDKLNVHLVCHTHDDVGWLKTVDQYYYGQRQNIQKAGVQYILDTVTAGLEANPDRTFVYVEMGFFERWWNEQSDAKQASVKRLVATGQLTFANGGYTMHDEATTHYVGMIDQTTRGHRFLKETFGYVPTIGWQLDPFGHSTAQAYLLGTDLGFKAMVLGRSDHADLADRKAQRAMEFWWSPSPTFGDKKRILAQVRPDGNYQPPAGFCFDYALCADEPIADDTCLEDYNVGTRVDDFVARARELANMTLGNDILFTMGSDFQWADAHTSYKNLDKLIHYANKDGRVNVFYSSPERYFDAKLASGIDFPSKQDDFFPYSDFAHAFWAGYFTSRPTHKRFSRVAQSYLNSARQLEYMTGKSRKDSSALEALESATAIMTHHDAITGTEKQAVANDYAKRISAGMSEASASMDAAFKVMLDKQEGNIGGAQAGAAGKQKQPNYPSLHAAEQSEGADFVQCPLLNVSSCPITFKASQTTGALQMVMYNPLPVSRETFVTVPVDYHPTMNASVQDHLLEAVESNLVGPEGSLHGVGLLMFNAHVPPLGMTVYYISFWGPSGSDGARLAHHAEVEEVHPTDGLVTIEGRDGKSLTFDAASGHLRYEQRRVGAPRAPVTMMLAVYNSSNGDYDGSSQPSGAYIFRPRGEIPPWKLGAGYEERPRLTRVKGSLFERVVQRSSPHLTLSTTAVKSDPASVIVVDWEVDALPIADGNGKEVVLRLDWPQLDSGETFYTDSNGRDMIERTRNHRPTYAWNATADEPVAGNYYPVNAFLAITDGQTAASFVTDRSHGGSSLASGKMEIMVHRRTLSDDYRGVGEAMNETACGCRLCDCEGLSVTGTTHYVVGNWSTTPRQMRASQLELQEPVVLAFRQVGEPEPVPLQTMMEQGETFPSNVHLVTFHALEPDSVLVRIAHIFGAGEDLVLSTNAYVDLADLFFTRRIKQIKEVSLSANQEIEVLKDAIVMLKPMEVRTFIVKLDSDTHKVLTS